MAAADSIREVPDSEDELLSSSPAEALDGDADKLSAAARVPHQAAQDALQRAAQNHQENAENVANTSEELVGALTADQENAFLDVNAARDLENHQRIRSAHVQLAPEQVAGTDDKSAFHVEEVESQPDSHFNETFSGQRAIPMSSIQMAQKEYSGRPVGEAVSDQTKPHAQHEVSTSGQLQGRRYDLPDTVVQLEGFSRDIDLHPKAQRSSIESALSAERMGGSRGGMNETAPVEIDADMCERPEAVHEEGESQDRTANIESEDSERKLSSQTLLEGVHSTYGDVAGERQMPSTLDHNQHGEISKANQYLTIDYADVEVDLEPESHPKYPAITAKIISSTSCSDMEALNQLSGEDSPSQNQGHVSSVVASLSLSPPATGHRASPTGSIINPGSVGVMSKSSEIASSNSKEHEPNTAVPDIHERSLLESAQSKADSFELIPAKQPRQIEDSSAIPLDQAAIAHPRHNIESKTENRFGKTTSASGTFKNSKDCAIPCPQSSAETTPKDVVPGHESRNVDSRSETETQATTLTQPQPATPRTQPSPQETTIAELKAHKAALLTNLASLPTIQVLMEETDSQQAATQDESDEATDVDIMAAANKIVKEHIKLLHQYNELKDVGQGLMGLIADQRGVRIVEVQEEFGIDGND